MKYKVIYIVMAVAMLSASAVSAQNSRTENFVVRANADMSLGEALVTDYVLAGISSKTKSYNYGVDFGWIFWQYKRHSLDANIGIGFSQISMNFDCPKMDFSYSAPPAADMDNESYIRYCELSNLHQKIESLRLMVPVYLNYRFQISKVFSVHALLGYKFGFNATSKIAEANGDVFSYGIYPQYDNLMIDAPYMNEFGESVVNADQTAKPKPNKPTASLLTGVGAEARIWGPLSVGITFKYEWAMNEGFKPAISNGASFNEFNAPVTYTVAEGQKVTPLTNYLSAKTSHFSAGLSLICRF